MAQIGNVYKTGDAVGNREDLVDVIYKLTQDETPITSNVGRTTATNVLHQWQTDTLPTASTTASAQGETFSAAASASTTLLTNYTHISKRDYTISGTQKAVTHAGGNELDRLRTNNQMALMTDIEKVISDNNAKVAPSGSTASETAGLGAWLVSNQSTAGDGTDPTGDGTDVRAGGTARNFTEDMIHAVMESTWSNGGRPSMLVAPAFNRRKISGFAGQANRQSYVDANGTLRSSVKVFETDFGDLVIYPSAFMPSVTSTDVVYIIDPERLKVAYLRPIDSYEIGKQGDGDGYTELAEYALEVSNPKAHGIVADLTQS